MRKLKFLLLALAATISLGAWAKTDVTNTYLQNANLKSLDGWDILDNFKTAWITDGDVAAIEFYSEWSSKPGEPWGQTKTFNFSQSPSFPAGYYRLCVNAFYREGNGNGTNTKAYIYAGSKNQYVVGLSSAGVSSYTGKNDLYKAANAFSLGEFSNEFDFQVTEENANKPLEIGFHGVFNTWCSWCCLGPVTIYEYGVEDYMGEYDKLVPQAMVLYDSPMNAGVLSALKEAADKKESLSTIDEVLKACEVLKTKIADAKASIAEYVKINGMINLLNENGKSAFTESIGKYNSGEWLDYNDFIEGSSFYSYLKKYPKNNTDFTMFIVNPEINGSDGWTCVVGNGGNGPLLNGQSFEYWIGTAANGNFDYYQVINDLPNGHYNIGVQMYNSSNGVNGDAPNGNVGLYGFANNTQKFVGCIIDEDKLSTYTLEDVIVTDGTLRLGVKNNGTMGARWFVADDFTLTFVSGMTETDAALIALNTVLEQAKALIDANATATVSLKEKIAADYNTYKAYTSETGIDVIKAATTDMAAQIVTLNASITAYANLKAAYEPYEGNTKVETLYNEAKGIYEEATKTTDEVNTYIKVFTRGVAIATIETPYTGSEVAEGTFYLYNPASGKFMTGGNNYGTQISLSDVGQPVIIKTSGSGYTIDSQISNGGNNHYVGNAGYLDAASVVFSIEGEDFVTISWADGTKMYGYDGATTVVATQTVETIGSYWQLVSADEIIKIAKEKGSMDTPFEVTSLVKDWNFGRNNTLKDAWKIENKSGGNFNISNSGNWKYFATEAWNNTFKFSQTIANLPNGVYKVTAQGYCTGGNAYLFAGNEKSAFQVPEERPADFQTASENIGKGMYTGAEVTVCVVDETLTLGAGRDKNSNQDWAVFSNFRLYYCGVASFDATMTQVGDAAYSSMYLDFPVEIPEGVKAYYVTVEGRTATMNEIEGVIPANCGVILKAAEDVDKITFTQTSTEATTDVSSNVLIGFVVDTEVNDGKAHYAFSYKDDKVGFYIPASAENGTDPTSKFTAKAHKAYIELESAPNSKLDITWGGEATGINTIDNGQLTIDNSKAYNLNGIRVNPSTGSGQAYKGIVLKGGKKFLQK